MKTLRQESAFTPETILKAFKMLGLDNPETRDRLNSFCKQSEKLSENKQKIITVDSTLEPKEGLENA